MNKMLLVWSIVIFPSGMANTGGRGDICEYRISSNIFYKDTDFGVFGDKSMYNPNTISNENLKMTKKALGPGISSPYSLLLTGEIYPIPGISFSQKTDSLVQSKFVINVSENQSFEAKFRDIFKQTTVRFTY